MNLRWINFAIIGGLGFIADAAVFALCCFVAEMSLLTARAVSFLCAASVTWFGNRVVTFAERNRDDAWAQWIRSISGALFSSIPNFLVFQLAIMWLGEAPLQAMLALVLGVLAGMVSNYQLSNQWVFRSNKQAILEASHDNRAT